MCTSDNFYSVSGHVKGRIALWAVKGDPSRGARVVEGPRIIHNGRPHGNKTSLHQCSLLYLLGGSSAMLDGSHDRVKGHIAVQEATWHDFIRMVTSKRGARGKEEWQR